MTTATTPHVGARMEEVAPRKVTDPADRVRLLVLAGVAVAVHAWLINHTNVTARDSIGFARYALQLENPGAIKHTDGRRMTLTDILLHGQHPPGYPLAVLATSAVVRQTYHPDPDGVDPLAAQMLLSTQIVSGLAAVLLVFPSYWLGRMLFGKFAGFAAALLFQVLPVVAHVTSDGLTEGLYLFTLGTALLLGTRAVKNPGVGGSLLCGLACGLCYLVRPEGLAVVAAVGLVMTGLVVVRRWPFALTAGRLTALAVGVLIPTVPYMALIGGVTNKPTTHGIFQRLVNPRQNVVNGGVGEAPPPADAALFAAWYDPEKDGSLAGWAPRAIAAEGFKAFHYAPAVLAVVGLLGSVRRLRAEPWMWVPILLGGLMLLALFVLAYVGQAAPGGGRKHYISERHTLSVVYVGCFFAAGALEMLPGLIGPSRTWAKWVPAGVLAVLVASCVPATLKPLHESRAGHKEAGIILRHQAGEHDTIIDPWDWAQYYSGRTLRWIDPDPEPLAGRYRWAVLEPGENPNSETPRLPAAHAVANDKENKAELVGWWPKDGPPEKAKVLLYKQRITAADEARWRASQAGR